MLHDEVKRLADSGDVVGLRYVFVDALDADPTFEFYQEDYDYCRSKGLLELHQELTPLTQDKNRWTKDYWVHLKTDLRKNLSEKRLMHMKQVAQVLKEDEIRRITNERRQAAEAARLQEVRRQMEEMSRRKAEAEKKVEKAKEAERPASSATQTPSQVKVGTAAEEERRRIEALKAKYAREEAERKKRTEAARMETEKANAEERRKTASKKVTWIAIAAAILVIILAIILMVASNPGNAAAVLRAGAAFGKKAITAISF